MFTAGQTNQVEVTVSGVSPDLLDETVLHVYDRSPWEVTGYGDANGRDGKTVNFGTTMVSELSDGVVTRTYFAKVPPETGRDEFGPAWVDIESVDGVAGESDTFGGVDTNTVVGADQNALE